MYVQRYPQTTKCQQTPWHFLRGSHISSRTKIHHMFLINEVLYPVEIDHMDTNYNIFIQGLKSALHKTHRRYC